MQQRTREQFKLPEHNFISDDSAVNGSNSVSAQQHNQHSRNQRESRGEPGLRCITVACGENWESSEQNQVNYQDEAGSSTT